jgi:hypothetical protein
VAVFVAHLGVQLYLRYSNPRLDVTSSYYQKTLNSSIAKVGNVVEVKVQIYWHGHVIPEFKREVKIVDSFPENNFQLAEGSNIHEASGYGGSYQIRYLLKVTNSQPTNVELPEPRLYLDNAEILLNKVDSNLCLQILP